MTAPEVVVLDYGSGNVRSAVRALERVGAHVSLTADERSVLDADGLFVPGVGNFHACLRGLRAVDGHRLIDVRLSGSRPVLGICVGMQAMFEGSSEPSVQGAVPGAVPPPVGPPPGACCSCADAGSSAAPVVGSVPLTTAAPCR